MLDIVINSPARSSWGAILLVLAHPPLLLLLAAAVLVALVVVWLRASWRPPALALARDQAGYGLVELVVAVLLVLILVVVLLRLL